MLTNLKRRTALLLTAAVLCSVTVLAPTTASAAAWAPNATGVDVPGSTTGYLACPSGSAAAAGFTDTTSTDVDCIKMFGITQGATATTYDPAGNIPRWQMALFLNRLYTPTGLAAGTGTFTAFTDISGYSTEIQNAINAIAASGITVGTSTGVFSPADNVTREQMALFLDRMMDLLKDNDADNNGTQTALSTVGTSANGGYNYTDIGATTHEGLLAIVRLYDVGVTDGACAAGACPTTYRPSENMTRAEMATMLTRLLNHTNARPAGISIQTPTTNVVGETMATQISARNADFTADSNTVVEVIKQDHNDLITAVVPFHSVLGTCTVANVVASGTTECTIDAGDYVSNALGNAAGPSLTAAASHTLNWWAWTGASGATYVDGTTVAHHLVSTLGAASTATSASTATLTTSARTYATAYDLSDETNVTDDDGEYTPFGEAVTLTVTLTGAVASTAVVDGYSVRFAETRTDSLGNTTISSTDVISAGGVATFTVAAAADPVPAVVGGAANLGSWVSSEVTITMAGTGTGNTTGNWAPLGHASGGVSLADLTSGGYNTSWSDVAAVYTTASDTLAISQNTALAATAGTLVDATAKAHDQYGRGMAGKTVTFVVDDADKITATTGSDGTAVYSFVACTANGTDAVSTNTAASDMSTITATTPGAAASRGTTVYCGTAANDTTHLSFGDFAGIQEIQTATFSAVPDAGDFSLTYSGQIASGLAFGASATTIQDALNGLSNLSGVTVTSTGAGNLVVTFAANWGDAELLTLDGTTGTALTTAGAPVTASFAETKKGIGSSTDDFIEEDNSANTIMTLRTTNALGVATPTYYQITWDSTDAFNTSTIAGATEAQFETALKAVSDLTTQIQGAHRTGSTTTGITSFQLMAN